MTAAGYDQYDLEERRLWHQEREGVGGGQWGRGGDAAYRAVPGVAPGASLSGCQSVRLSLSVCPSVCLLSVRLFLSVCVCPSICLSVSLSVSSLSLSLSPLPR